MSATAWCDLQLKRLRFLFLGESEERRGVAIDAFLEVVRLMCECA